MFKSIRRTLLYYGPAGALFFLFDLSGSPLLAIVGAIALLAAVLADFAGLLGILVMIMPFSLGVLQIELGIITFNPYTLGIAALFVLSLGKVVTGRTNASLTAQDGLIAALCAVFLISTLLADDTIKAGYLAFHAIFIPVVTYFVVKANVSSTQDYRRLLDFLLLGIGLLALIAIWSFFTDSAQARLKIFGQSSISLAAFFSVGLIVIFFTGQWRQFWGKAIAALLTVALFTTFARGYIILLLLSPVFFILITRGHARRLLLTMLAASLLGTVFLASTPELMSADISSAERKSEQTVERLTNPGLWLAALRGRGALYQEGFKRFLDSPLLGNGFSEPAQSLLTVRRAAVWHNFHVEWLEYGGLLGYLAYICLLIVHFGRCSSLARQDRAVAINLLVIFTLLTNGLTNSFTAGITPYLGFLFIALNDTRIQLAVPGSASRRRRRRSAAEDGPAGQPPEATATASGA